MGGFFVRTGNNSVYRMLQLKGITGMRRIILLVLTMFSISVFGGNDDENISVRKIDNQYAINYYNFNSEIANYFTKQSLQAGGYTWEALVKAAVTTEAPELLSQIEFAAEGGSFIAYTASENVANKIKGIIEKLSANIDYREKNIKIATAGGYIE